MFLGCFFCIMFRTVSMVDSLVNGLYNVARGYKISDGTVLINVTLTAMTPSYCALLCTEDCNSAAFSEKFEICMTFKEKFYNSTTIGWIKDSDWLILYRSEELIQYNDWTLVFRGQKQINTSLYDVWMANGYHDDLPLSSGFPIGCYRMDNMGKCNRHFRSSILDNWTDIHQVRFSMFTNGSQVAYMVFNGSLTNRTSWYSRAALLESSWPILKNDSLVKTFTFAGVVSGKTTRRMTIVGAYGSCTSDTTYFLAVDTSSDVCTSSYKFNVTEFPLFVYSPLDRMARLGYQEHKFADVLAVFVKMKSIS